MFLNPLTNTGKLIPFQKPSAPRFYGKSHPSEAPPREKVVAVYGGASVKEDSPLYNFSYKVGKALAEAKLGVLTGGGPGTMAALTKGAESVDGYTYGMAMNFIGEAPCYDNDELHYFETFSSRIDDGYEAKAALTAAVPGGIGTLQELTKKAVELYTDKTIYKSQKQIVLFEFNGYWKKFINYLKDGPIKHGLMNPKVLDIFKVVPNIKQGVDLLTNPSVPFTSEIKNHQKKDKYRKPPYWVEPIGV